MRNLVFFVSDDSWAEHYRVGIAAINDPGLGNKSQVFRLEIVSFLDWEGHPIIPHK